MGFDAQDNTNTSVTSLKFKLPKNILSDSNACVPRKLRSAIRKRSYESASMTLPDAKRLNSRINDESQGRNSFKKSNLSMQKDRSTRQNVSFEISKDEEEVAETLFALAGMIPAVHKENKASNKSFDANSLDLSTTKCKESTPSSEDIAIQKVEPETTIPSPNGLSERRKPTLNMKVPVLPATFPIHPLLQACDDKKLSNATFFCGSTEQNRESMSKEIKPEILQLDKRESRINLGAADLAASQDRNNALTSKLLHESGVDGLSVRSSAVTFPSWLNNSSSSISGSVTDALPARKASCSINGVKNSWRRCIAHVCISHLIQGLQTSERKDTQPLDTSQMRPSQCSAAENKDDQTVTFSSGHMFGAGAHKLENSQAKKEGSSFSGSCDSKKQSYNFLSLSTGGAKVNDINRRGVTLETKDHILQLHSVGQHVTYVPCSTSQHCFSSLPFRDQATVVSAAPPSMLPQVNLQVPPSFDSPCGPAHMGATSSSKQQPHSKQHQNWTAQFRPGPFLSSHIANWKNSTLQAHSMNHNQVPRTSQETMGAKYLQNSQQRQQQLFGHCQSLPSLSSAKLQNGQLPSICEDKGGVFHPDGVLPLQLLCNERLLS